ncbi:hypothetical protein PAE9249_04483 [Paenibacillus sp. CECT 9249]|nr:hypothetical protein PAE9249_04483 [Paenibacillus sp. CECT 9249]
MTTMTMPSALCLQFANILGGSAEVVNGVCTVTRIRNNLQPLIQGRRTRSALAIAALFSFEDLDRHGNALNLGETVILQEEVNPFISALRARGLEVTALHNHWLFTKPVLMFIHWKSVEPPLLFAKKTAEAFRVLTTRTIHPCKSSGSSKSGGRSGGSCSSGNKSHSSHKSSHNSSHKSMSMKSGRSCGCKSLSHVSGMSRSSKSRHRSSCKVRASGKLKGSIKSLSKGRRLRSGLRSKYKKR